MENNIYILKNNINTMKMFIILLLLIPFSFAYVCDDSNMIPQGQTPCEIITPKDMDCSSNATIIYLEDPTYSQNISMNLKYSISNTYNFSFPYNYLGNYWVGLCDGNSAVLRVYPDNETSTNLLNLLTNNYNYLTQNNALLNNLNSSIQGETKYTLASSSEYSLGDNGMFAVTLQNIQGQPILNKQVTLNIYYPNLTLYYQNNLSELGSGVYYMIKNLPNSLPLGNYLVNFNSPNLTGSLIFKLTNSNTSSNPSSSISFVSPSTLSGNYSQNYIMSKISYSSSLNVTNITFRLYNTTLVNQTNAISGQTLNFTNLADGIYYLNVSITDSSSAITNSETLVINLDNQIPNVTLNSLSVEGTSVHFNLSSSEISKITINYSLLGVNYTYSESGYSLEHFITLSGLSSSSLYAYNISTCDPANNCNYSLAGNFLTGSSSSPGSGGGSINLYSLNVTTEDWLIGSENKVKIVSTDRYGNKIDLSALNLTIDQNISYKLTISRISLGEYEAVVKTGKTELTKLNFNIIAEDKGYVQSEKVEVKLRKSSLFSTISSAVIFNPDKLDSWIKENKVLFWMFLLIPFFFLVLLSYMIHYLKEKRKV